MILDVELIVGLLCSYMVVIGIDVMVYVIEVYISKYKKNVIFDVFVCEVLCLLVSNLILVCENGKD